MGSRILDVHLKVAEEFYKEDRLDHALEAYGNAMRDYGWAPGGWAGFYNEVVWEKAARDNGQMWDLAEDLTLEIPKDTPPWQVAAVREAALSAREKVRSFLDYIPEKPIMLTILLPETPLEFIPGPYGYMAEKHFIHKICIPYPTLESREELLETLIHEFTHAAEHDLSNDRCPRWLAEGISMYLSGELAENDRNRQLTEAARHYGLPPLWRIDALISAWYRREIEEDTGYTFAADLVMFLIRRFGNDAPGRLLRMIADRGLNGAFKAAFGISRRRFEFEWRRDLAGRCGIRFGAMSVLFKIYILGA